MSTPHSDSTLSTADLIEQAVFDMHGLLDEQERARFDRAFSAAPPHVQAHVRREQQRWADADDLLPRVEPPADLRGRVLDAVRREVFADQHAAGAPSPLRLTSRALPMWRASAIGMAAACVMLGSFGVYLFGENARLAGAHSIAQIEQEFLDTSPRLQNILFSQAKQEVAFTAAVDVDGSALTEAQAKLFIDTEQRIAVLVCRGLPRTVADYTLVIETPEHDGVASVVKKRPAVNGQVTFDLDNIRDDEIGRMAIHGPREGSGEAQVLLRAGEV